ncbi:MAG: hypothetical protein ABSG95_13080 [Solirubrobacteraceae bacterium]|jgi:hypothetical protein
MAPPAVGTGTLRRLGALDTKGRPVLSVYLDPDCRGAPSAAVREGALDELLAGVAWRTVEAELGRVREIVPRWTTNARRVRDGAR